MVLNINNKSGFNFYSIFSACLFCIGLALTEFLVDLQPLMTTFFVVYILTLVYSINTFGWLSLYCIYLYTSAFFMYDCIFLSLLSSSPSAFLLQDFPVRYSFSEDVGKVFIICCFLTVYFGHISFCLFSRKKCCIGKNQDRLQNLQYVHKFEQFGVYIFLIALIPVCTKILIQLQFVMNYGFPAIYTSHFEEIKYPIWCTGAFLIFNTGYLIVLASNPNRKKFIIYTSISLFVSFLDALKGGRGGVISALIVSLYWYSKKYGNGKQFNLRKLILFFICVILVISFITVLRESYDGHDTFSNKTFIEKIYDILWTQTTSRAVPMLIIRGDLEYHPYPFLFSPFTGWFLKLFYNYKAATMDYIRTFNDPSIVLISNVSLGAGLIGSGYGSAFIGEAYEIDGYIGIVLCSVMFSYFIFVLEGKICSVKNRSIPLVYTFISTIPIAPRKEIFQFFKYDLMTMIVCYITLFFISLLIQKRKG